MGRITSQQRTLGKHNSSLPHSLRSKLHLAVVKQSSGGSDCQRQSVCRRHKTQQFQLSLPTRYCSIRNAEIAASCGLHPPRLLPQSRLPRTLCPVNTLIRTRFADAICCQGRGGLFSALRRTLKCRPALLRPLWLGLGFVARSYRGW